MNRYGERGRGLLGNIMLVLVIAAAGYGAKFYLPHYYVNYKMGDVVEETLFEWRDTNRENKAETRLGELLEEREIPEYVDARDSCKLAQLGRYRHLKCGWQVLVRDPIFGETWLKFEIYKCLNPEGLLEDDPRSSNPNHQIKTL